MERSSEVLIFIDNKNWVLGENGALQPFMLAQRPDGQKRHIVKIYSSHCPEFGLKGLHQSGHLGISFTPFRAASVQNGSAVGAHREIELLWVVTPAKGSDAGGGRILR